MIINSKTILFTGGGTLGSVTPLLNVWEKLKQRSPNCEAVWVGSKGGPEELQVSNAGIKYYSVSSGKLRRYFSFKTFIDPFKIMIGFFDSWFLLKKLKPSVVVGAGSFIQVPVCFAAYLLKIPVVIYQMDVRTGLANLLCAKVASVIAIALPNVKYPWNELKQVLVGVVSPNMKGAGEADKILIFGGGTGAKYLNDVVEELVEIMPSDWQVVHVCGQGKCNKQLKNKSNYTQHESLLNGEMLTAIRDARVVICRAGMGALFEIGYFGKPAIIIPLANSHQEDNASYYANKEAIIVINQEDLSAEVLTVEIEKILSGEYSYLQKNIATITNYDGADKLGALILRSMN